MFQKNFTLLALLLSIACTTFAQAPAGYYDSANGLTGSTLKSALHNVVDGHIEYPYTSSSTDVWDILKETDKDPNNTNNVILFYTGWSVDAAQEYNSGAGWTREHVWAKSRGNFGTSPGAGTDAHHLRPSDNSVNSARNNRWFDTGDFEYIDGDGATACMTSSARWVWEPRPEVKGDVARMLFYMVVRYEGTNGDPDLELVDYLPTDDSTQEPIHAVLSTLLAWHEADPVDAFEQNRNEVVYAYQGNRNPFIDNPSWACDIWGGSCNSTPDTQAPSVPSNLMVSNISSNGANLSWAAATDNIGVTGYKVYVDGTFNQTVSNTTATLTGLTSTTTYNITVSAVDAATNESGTIASSFTTTAGAPPGPAMVETFDNFSEGGSYQNGSFLGQDGSTWYYDQCRGDIAITNSSATLGKGRTPNATITSGTLTGGCATLKFDYMQAFSTGVNMNVYVNGVLVANVTGSTQNNAASSGDIAVNVSGDFVISFEQASSSAGQVVIDNIEWTSMSTPDTEAPSTPTALAINNITETAADLTWNAATDNVAVASYNVFLNGVLYTTTTQLSANFNGLTASTNYNVAVTALDEVGNESAAGTTSFTTATPVSNANETFANFSEGGSYQNGTFLGQDGSTWSYNQCRGDITIIGSAPTLGKGRTPNATVTSGTLTGGCGTLQFDYMQAFSSSINMNVYVNGVLVTNVNNGTQSAPTSSGNITVDIAGDFVISFEQVNSSAGQITIDNISWTTFEAAPDNQVPSAPNGLEITNVTETSADFAWLASTDNLGVEAYDIYLDGSLYTTTTTLSTSFTGLNNSTTYTVGVVALDAAANESNTTTISFTTDTPTSGPETVFAHYFETGWDGWNDGGSDCARYNGTNSYEGNYSIRIRDNSGTSSAMTSPTYDLSSYSTATLNFHFYAHSMENNEDFFVKYSDDNGSTWTTIETFARGTDFNNNSFYAVSLDLTQYGVNLSNTAKFRIQCDASGNNDQIYIDQITLIGDATQALATIVTLDEELNIDNTTLAKEETTTAKMTLYPNPAVETVNLAINTTGLTQFIVFDVHGNVVKQGEFEATTRIDITSLSTGVYFVIATQQDGQQLTSRFIRK